MEQAFPKLLGGLAPVTIALVVFIQAYVNKRAIFLNYWITGLLCYWLRHVTALMIESRLSGASFIAWIYGILVMVGAFCLMAGIRILLNKKTIYWPAWILLVGTMTSFLLVGRVNATIMAFPACLAVGNCYALAALAIYQSRQFKQWPGRMLFASLLIMFNLQSFFTPLAFLVTTTNHWHFLFSGLAEAFLMVSLVVFYFHLKEQQLLAETKKAEEALLARDRFLANMSHELRTPLHGIFGMLELALPQSPDPRHRQYLEMAQNSAKSMLARVEELLNLASLEQGKPTLKKVRFSLRRVIDNVLGSLAGQSRQAGLEFTGYVEARTPDRITGDPDRLEQVLLNLTANALKFTHQGKVRLFAGTTSRKGDKIKVLFQVRDTGIGIAQNKIKEIFEPFKRLEDSLDSTTEGSGLGLAISRQLVRAMGGELKVRSRPGQGTLFFFELWYKVPRYPQPPTEAYPKNKAAIFSPWPGTNKALKHMLLYNGLVIKDVSLAGLSVDPIGVDLIFIDRSLESNVMNNLEKIQNNPQVILISNSEQTKSGRQIKSTTQRPVLYKPLRQADINSVLESIPAKQAKKKESPVKAQKSFKINGRSPRVLLVEDNPVSQIYLTELLGQKNISTDLAKNGNQAVEMASRKKYHLILMDMRIPGLDGLRATRLIKSLPESLNQKTPMTALTAQAYDSDRKAAKEAGLDFFLKKPLQTEKLDKILGTIFKAEINKEKRGQNNSCPENLVEMFLKTLPREMALFEGLVKDENYPELTRATHRFKSSLVFFKADTSMTSTKELQKAAEEKDLKKVIFYLGELKSNIQNLAAMLKSEHTRPSHISSKYSVNN